MAFKPTSEQLSAIETTGNILVSAAAGSGKTAVLVERVIKKLCDSKNGISADKLLIVTFTNAAAAEMRSRIEKRLEEEIALNPYDTALIMQRHLLSSAKICTIDSFCIDLVRENFEKADVSPDFKISDGNSLQETNEKVLYGIIGKYLQEKNPIFFELLDIIGAEYDENNFAEFVLSIYNYSRQLPFPEKWFKSLSEDYNGKFCFEENKWYKYAFEKAERVTEECITSLANAVDLISVNETAANSYMPEFIESSSRLNKLKEAALTKDWDVFYNALEEFCLPKLPTVRGLSDIYEVTAAKDIYKYIDKKVPQNLKKIFFANSYFIKSQFAKIRGPLSLLSEILIEFDKALFEEYKRINTFTFHNTEHLALKLLCEEVDGKIKIRQDTAELLNRFEEVMVDEYQDTNDLQDMLFYVLSDKEKRLFTVGDVKQSIYGFRGANPKNFLNKKQRYIPFSEALEEEPKKIILGNNFRCKPEVCDFVNFLFSLFMTENTGDIVYNEEEKLIPAAVYPKVDELATQIGFIDAKGSELSDIQLEACRIAEYIKTTISKGNIIRKDDNTLRNAEFSDFTILLRSAKLKAPLLAEELKKQGIPVTYSIEDFAESIEISVMLSLLTVIDNPRSDIELLSVMMSAVFGFTPEELAQIRISNRKENLYTAVVNSAENKNGKAKDFLEKIENFRLLAAINPLPKLINLLLYKTGFLEIVTVMNDGMRRRNNLLLLCDYAAQFYENSGGSISGFVSFIKKQSKMGIKAAGSLSGGNSVKIMSIHASKGLQFPVCILASLSSDFNDSEARDNTIFTTESGIGFKYYDETEKQRYTTLSREVILDKIRSERLCEELRLLYVALTRTQDRLFMTVTLNDVYKKCEELKTLLISSGGKITSNVFSRTKSYSDWLILSLLLHPEGKQLRGNASALILAEDNSKIDISVTNSEQLVSLQTKEKVEDAVIDYDLAQKIKQNIEYEYPYQDILDIESKASVSKLANSAESVKYAFSGKPSFMSEGGITATERGSAMHKVIEFFDFSKCDDVESELERLYEWQYITEKEYESVNIGKLKRFFESDVFSRIKNSDLVKREMRFLTELGAKNIKPDLNENLCEEKIVVQGAVDICFTEPDGIVILDFKTDRVETTEELINAYSEQLEFYAIACEKIFGKKVKEKIIYSFALSQEIEV